MTGQSVMSQVPVFHQQAAALLRARRAVSRQQRRESGRVSWLANATVGVAAFALLGLAFLLGVSAAGEAGGDRARSSVVLFGSAPAAILMLAFVNLQEAPEVHPLGGLRQLLPVTRLRGELLGALERQFSPAGIWVLGMGIAPWLGLAVAGQWWLNPAGCATVIGLALAAVAVRELVHNTRRYLQALLQGFIPRVGATLLIFVWAGGFLLMGQVVDAVALDADGILDLPLLRVANSAAGPATVLALAATTGLAGVAVGAAKRPKPRRLRWSLMRRRALRMPAVRFLPGRRDLLLARLMLAIAVRQPAYQYAAASLVVLCSVTVIFPQGPGQGLLMIMAYIVPAGTFYNLYGADSKHYSLLLAVGATLGEWTRARQVFSAIYLGSFVTVMLAILLASGSLAPGEALTIALPVVPSAIIAAIIGPRISRFVATPTSPGRDGLPTGGLSSRRWVAWAGAVLVYLTIGPIAVAPVVTGFWWAYPLLCVALLALWALVRPDRREWDGALRTRFARAFV